MWPPLWKKQGKSGPEKTLKDKMLEKGKALADKAQAKAAEMAQKASVAAQKAAAEAKGETWVAPVETVVRAETEEEKKYEIATSMKKEWKEKKDSSGNTYYYNRDTSALKLKN